MADTTPLSVPEEALDRLAAVRKEGATSRIAFAIAIVAAACGLVALTVLIVRARADASRIEALQTLAAQRTSLADARLAQLNVTLARLSQVQGERSPLLDRAIRQADQASATLAQVKAIEAVDASALSTIVSPPESRTESLLQVASGSRQGWDVDIFWCAGVGQDRNYSTARGLAILAGVTAANRTAIAPGISLGRIRIRPVREQDRGAWPKGAYAVWGRGKGEGDAANALSRFLTSRQPQPLGMVYDTGAPTPYYLSLFVCGT